MLLLDKPQMVFKILEKKKLGIILKLFVGPLLILPIILPNVEL
jgi:hypothetical protein